MSMENRGDCLRAWRVRAAMDYGRMVLNQWRIGASFGMSEEIKENNTK